MPVIALPNIRIWMFRSAATIKMTCWPFCHYHSKRVCAGFPDRNADRPSVIGDNSNVVTTVIFPRNHCRRIPFGMHSGETITRSPICGRKTLHTALARYISVVVVGNASLSQSENNTRLYSDKQQKYPWTHKYTIVLGHRRDRSSTVI